MSTNNNNYRRCGYTIKEQLEILYIEGKLPGHLFWDSEHDELRRKVLTGKATPKEVDSYAHSLLLKEKKDKRMHGES